MDQVQHGERAVGKLTALAGKPLDRRLQVPKTVFRQGLHQGQLEHRAMVVRASRLSQDLSALLPHQAKASERSKGRHARCRGRKAREVVALSPIGAKAQHQSLCLVRRLDDLLVPPKHEVADRRRCTHEGAGQRRIHLGRQRLHAAPDPFSPPLGPRRGCDGDTEQLTTHGQQNALGLTCREREAQLSGLEQGCAQRIHERGIHLQRKIRIELLELAGRQRARRPAHEAMTTKGHAQALERQRAHKTGGGPGYPRPHRVQHLTRQLTTARKVTGPLQVRCRKALVPDRACLVAGSFGSGPVGLSRGPTVPGRSLGHRQLDQDAYTTIPASRVERVQTIFNNQDKVVVTVYQGESRRVENNIKIGELPLRVPPKLAGEEKVDIRFTYDINGVLEVETTTLSTGATARRFIEGNPGVLTPQEIEKRFADLASLKLHPRDQAENQAALARAERLYEESLGETRQVLQELLRRFEEVLDGQDPRSIQKARYELSKLLVELDGDPYL